MSFSLLAWLKNRSETVYDSAVESSLSGGGRLSLAGHTALCDAATGFDFTLVVEVRRSRATRTPLPHLRTNHGDC